jgi:dTDP-4-dehydrorhamnose reductase
VSVVVLGAQGLLGRHVVEELGAGALALGRGDCDIPDVALLRRCLAGAELVIKCAGFTNVDGAERDEAGAHRANVLGVQNLVRAAADAKLVHISTDFVFDGAQAEPYDESARPNPQSVYARSKWLGEEAAQAHPRRFVVRVQALYGRGGSNFASKLRQLILDGKSLKLDGERRVQPTWARVAARLIARIGQTDAFGTYHVSCAGETNWAAFAARMAERLGVAPRWRVVRSDELDAPAKRPANCTFSHQGLQRLGIPVPQWEDAQMEYLESAP